MSILEVSNISKSFSDGYAVEGVSLNADSGEIVGLLGPSGCGKTTLLRLVAGLEQPDSGSLSFDGVPMNGLAPKDRGFGLMFQDLALFPHMDVVGNVSFGLRMQKLPKLKVRARVDELLALVDLAGYGHRKMHELSGGERQRVALARSLAPEPKLLMFDEPFGSLDRGLRESLQMEVRAILKKIGMTSIYVTHDRDEAFAMADSIVIMDKGSVVQAGTAQELFRSPKSELVARSLGLKNVIQGTVTAIGKVDTPIGALRVDQADPSTTEGTSVLAIIDDRKISVVGDAEVGSSLDGTFKGVVESVKFLGGESDVMVRIADGLIACSIRPEDAGAQFGTGDAVCVTIAANGIRMVPIDG